jgi:ATP-dependent Clp protease ATP-binding subunit ClpB
LFGARPLKRTIQRYILDELAMQIIEGKIWDNDEIFVDEKNQKFIWKIDHGLQS